MSVRRKYIRALVDDLIGKHQITAAPVDVEYIARSMGISVVTQSVEADISGFLYRQRHSTIIGVNSHHFHTRQRFTIAHELGHFLLHTHEDVHVDKFFEVKLRSNKFSPAEELEEKEANLFAAELLMPKQLLDRELESIDGVDLLDEKELQALAEEYAVSTQAMTFRLSYLGYVQL